MTKKIVITGGHFTPALAVIEEMRGQWQIFWIGEEKAVKGHRVKTIEARVLPNIKIPFYPIETYKLHRRFTLENIFGIWKFGFGFIKSILILLHVRPDVVLSFGSYVAIPVVFAAWILGIPIVTHEQTTASGLANKIVARFAKFVAISHIESGKHFPDSKIVYTGNPVRRGIFEMAKTRNLKQKGYVVYITGGSRGSQIINRAVVSVLSEILKMAKVIHQTGELDYEKLKSIKEGLSANLSKDYELSANFFPSQVEEIYKKATLVVSRAGANTVSELAVIGIPAILIPIPWSEADEQTKNAKMLEKEGAAIIIPEAELEGDTLLQSIKQVFDNYDKYSKSAQSAKKLIPESASNEIILLLEKCTHEQNF